MQPGDQSGRVKCATCGHVQGGLITGASAARDQCGHPVAVADIHHRANVDAFVQRIAKAQRGHAGLEFGMKTLGHALLDQ